MPTSESKQVNLESLSAQMRALVTAAKAAADSAYAPYSNFPVGAAVLTEGGDLFTGCNVENASFGLTMCAERVAVGQAVAHGKRKISAIAVYTATAAATTPCGACRQVIFEFGREATVLCAHGSMIEKYSMSELLPNGFGPTALDGNV